jgi:hypothetical protein
MAVFDVRFCKPLRYHRPITIAVDLMTKISGIRATLAVQHALDEAGLKRTSKDNGAATNGWIAAHYYRAYGFGVKEAKEPGMLDWSVVISGEPHMKYEENEYLSNGERMTSNDPVNPEVLFPRIKKVFEGLGIEVAKVEKTGHQTMWNDDVSYNITSKPPAWLEAYNPDNTLQKLTSPRLVAATLIETKHSKVKSFTALPMYQLSDKTERNPLSGTRFFLRDCFAMTKEALSILKENNDSSAKYRPELVDAITFDGETLVLRQFMFSGDYRERIQPTTITNHWGDEVKVYKWPEMNVEIERKYTSDCPMLINGEITTTVDFLTLDSQYDGEGPWTPEPEAAAFKI